jgi:hypothetical protein
MGHLPVKAETRKLGQPRDPSTNPIPVTTRYQYLELATDTVIPDRRIFARSSCV